MTTSLVWEWTAGRAELSTHLTEPILMARLQYFFVKLNMTCNSVMVNGLGCCEPLQPLRWYLKSRWPSCSGQVKGDLCNILVFWNISHFQCHLLFYSHRSRDTQSKCLKMNILTHFSFKVGAVCPPFWSRLKYLQRCWSADFGTIDGAKIASCFHS